MNEEEEYANTVVGSHKLINNLVQAIRFMSTNEKLTVEGIIKEFSKENEVTEAFMERWEKNQYEESHLKDKVIDMMTKDISNTDMFPWENIDSGKVKEYYFKKARGEEDVKD